MVDTTADQAVVRGPRVMTIAAITALAALVYVALRLLAHDGDETSFIRVGTDALAEDAPQRDDFYLVSGMGYDGHYYYRQALAPLSTDPLVDGFDLDRPAYRSARIGYPAAAWLLAGGGQRAAVPWSLIGVNVLSMAVVGGAGAAIARHLGRSTTWGLVFAAWPGLLVGLGFDLAEPLEAALVLCALLWARRERYALVTLALCAAAATRESSLLISVAFLAAWVLPRLFPGVAARYEFARRRIPLHPALLPIATYLALQVWMAARWGDDAVTADSTQAASHFSPIPGFSLLQQLGDWFSDLGPVELYSSLQVMFMALFFAGIVAVAMRATSAATLVERLAVLFGVLAVLMLGYFDRPVVYLRWPNVAAMAGLVVYLTVRDRPPWLTDRIVWGSVVALFATTLPIWIMI